MNHVLFLQNYNPKTVNGLLITLNALQQLWKVLKEEAGFKFLSLRRLNQDCLENLFGIIRQLNALNLNPTCGQFESALKTATINNLAAYKPRGANCELDDDQLLTDLKTLLQNKDNSTAIPQVRTLHMMYQFHLLLLASLLGLD